MKTQKIILFLMSLMLIWAAPSYTQVGMRFDEPQNQNNLFQENVLIVTIPEGSFNIGEYGTFIEAAEDSFNTAIETSSLNPNNLGSNVVEKHVSSEDLGREGTIALRDFYENAGYDADLSDIFQTGQLGIVGIDKIPYGYEPPPDYVIDPLMVFQIPWALGEDDQSGFPNNEGGYLRARYSLWPPDDPVQKEVLLVILDTGFYWMFPDFQKLLWQNLGEDIDGDGQTIEDLGNGVYVLDPGDLNGRNDDPWGYNDLIGWDFVNQDEDPVSDPYEFTSHGTSVFSVVGSETYNGEYMAGLLWPGYVKIVPCKVGSNWAIYEAEAIEAFYYAAILATQDQPVIVNCSWYGLQQSEPMEEAIGIVRSLGGQVVACVGNQPDGLPRYPANSAGVEPVAATNWENKRAPYSNYGEWMGEEEGRGIAAPGDSILAATWIPSLGTDEIEFRKLNGTSFSSVFVAGTAAMYRATHASLTWDQVMEAVLAGVYTPEDYPYDPYEGWPPYYGAGILDAKLVMEQ